MLVPDDIQVHEVQDFRMYIQADVYKRQENGQISSNGLYFTDKDGKITIHGVVGTLVVTETATIPGYTCLLYTS